MPWGRVERKKQNFHEIQLADKTWQYFTSAVEHFLQLRKTPELLSFFSQLYLYFPYFIQLWKTSLQISMLPLDFQTLYEPCTCDTMMFSGNFCTSSTNYFLFRSVRLILATSVSLIERNRLRDESGVLKATSSRKRGFITWIHSECWTYWFLSKLKIDIVTVTISHVFFEVVEAISSVSFVKHVLT